MPPNPSTPTLATTAIELLRALFDWKQEHSSDLWIDTQRASSALVERLRALGETYVVFRHGPWFGLADEVKYLEGLGLIEFDPGMAEFVAPGSPTPEAKRYFLQVTLVGENFIREQSIPT